MPAQPKLTPCDPCLQKSKTKSPAEEEEKICAVQAVKKAEKEGEDDVIQCYYLRGTQHNYDWCRGKPGTPYDAFRNYHSDHHTLHTKNVALSCGALLDFYFGTQGPKTSVTEGLVMSRRTEEGQIVIEVVAANPHDTTES